MAMGGSHLPDNYNGAELASDNKIRPKPNSPSQDDVEILDAACEYSDNEMRNPLKD